MWPGPGRFPAFFLHHVQMACLGDRQVCQSDNLQAFDGQGCPPGAAASGLSVHHPHRDVFKAGHFPKGPRHLKCAGNAASADLVGRPPANVFALEPNRAGTRRERPGHDVEQGCLAGAVRPDESHDCPFFHLEIHVQKGLDAAEGLGDANALNQFQIVLPPHIILSPAGFSPARLCRCPPDPWEQTGPPPGRPGRKPGRGTPPRPGCIPTGFRGRKPR